MAKHVEIESRGTKVTLEEAIAKSTTIDTETMDAIWKSGESIGLSFRFDDGDIIEFPERSEMRIDVRDIKIRGKERKQIFISVHTQMKGDIWAPMSAFRTLPTEKDLEKFYEVSPISKVLLDPAKCVNDLDRIEFLCGKTVKAFSVDGLNADKLVVKNLEDGSTVREREVGGRPFTGSAFKETDSSIQL